MKIINKGKLVLHDIKGTISLLDYLFYNHVTVKLVEFLLNSLATHRDQSLANKLREIAARYDRK